MTNDARKMLSWIMSVFSDRSSETMLLLYKSLVRSRLEYCSPLWDPSKIEDIAKIESVQRTFTSKIAEVRHLSYYGRLKALNLMSLQRRRERYIIIHIYKLHNNLAPNDVSLQFYETPRRGWCCKIPPLVKNCKPRLQKLYDESFTIKGAKLWNMIPKSIKEKTSLETFKGSLTKLILRLPDNPPVPGRASQNSLLYILATDNTAGNYGELAGGLEDRRRMS